MDSNQLPSFPNLPQQQLFNSQQPATSYYPTMFYPQQTAVDYSSQGAFPPLAASSTATRYQPASTPVGSSSKLSGFGSSQSLSNLNAAVNPPVSLGAMQLLPSLSSGFFGGGNIGSDYHSMLPSVSLSSHNSDANNINTLPPLFRDRSASWSQASSSSSAAAAAGYHKEMLLRTLENRRLERESLSTNSSRHYDDSGNESAPSPDILHYQQHQHMQQHQRSPKRMSMLSKQSTTMTMMLGSNESLMSRTTDASSSLFDSPQSRSDGAEAMMMMAAEAIRSRSGSDASSNSTRSSFSLEALRARADSYSWKQGAGDSLSGASTSTSSNGGSGLPYSPHFADVDEQMDTTTTLDAVNTLNSPHLPRNHPYLPPTNHSTAARPPTTVVKTQSGYSTTFMMASILAPSPPPTSSNSLATAMVTSPNESSMGGQTASPTLPYPSYFSAQDGFLLPPQTTSGPLMMHGGGGGLGGVGGEQPPMWSIQNNYGPPQGGGAGAASNCCSPSTMTSHSGSPSSTAMMMSLSNSFCVVCEDKASGYHYGVVSCEGCKGFFRRSVQKSIVYQCHKHGDCPVDRITRNRCQACRYHKCLRMGMAKESVRQDRNRKRKGREEQADEELRATARVQSLIQAVVAAHSATSPLRQQHDNTGVKQESPASSGYAYLREQLAADGGLRCVADFAGRLPGFDKLADADRRLLLERRRFGVLVIRTAYETMLTSSSPTDATPTSEEDAKGSALAAVLAASAARLSVSFQRLNVELREAALLSAVYLVHAACPNLEEASRVERLQDGLTEALGVSVQLRAAGTASHHQKNLFARLLMKIADIAAVTDGVQQQQQS